MTYDLETLKYVPEQQGVFYLIYEHNYVDLKMFKNIIFA
jgi:hypothetical protein